MKFILTGFFGICILLFSCHAPENTKDATTPSDPLDIASQDSSVKPQSNFYLFANGTWLKTTECHGFFRDRKKRLAAG